MKNEFKYRSIRIISRRSTIYVCVRACVHARACGSVCMCAIDVTLDTTNVHAVVLISKELS